MRCEETGGLLLLQMTPRVTSLPVVSVQDLVHVSDPVERPPRSLSVETTRSSTGEQGRLAGIVVL
jgi:hypothetical protein